MALAVLLLISLVALVKVQVDQDVQDRLDEISNYMNEPEIALESLQRWLRGFSLADRPVALLLL